MPVEIEATYRVVTPLFCAGADGRRAEVRLPSFKGVLRFWWRALAWSRCGGDLQKIREQEDALFGSSDGGQSRVLLRLDHTDRQRSAFGRDLSVAQGARYLGYGVMDRRADKERSCLCSPFSFTIHLRGHDLLKTQVQSLQRALTALGVMGGMGARSRNGYGSLVMESLCVNGHEQWRVPKAVNDLRDRIKTLHSSPGPKGLPEYTALSEITRHVLISSVQTEPLNLLDLMGLELKDAIQACDRHRRIAFGLPRGHRNDRRASPLFIHIHECGDMPVAVLSFLPARFLPEGESDISVGGSRVRQQPEADLYRPVHGFLDRLLDQGKRKEGFTDVVEVTP